MKEFYVIKLNDLYKCFEGWTSDINCSTVLKNSSHDTLFYQLNCLKMRTPEAKIVKVTITEEEI